MFVQSNSRLSRKRLIILIAFIAVFGIVLELNLFRIQIINNDFYTTISKNQYLKKIPLPARRGLVLDNNGNQLISNIIHYDLAADPKMVKNKRSIAQYCSRIFKKDQSEFLHKLEQKKRFVYLKRKVLPDRIKPILNLNDPGIITIENFRREYPYRNYAAHILGFTDPDDNGLSGLELQYDDILRGKDGHAVLQYDGPRRVFYNADNPVQRPDNGLNIHLTIDKNIQTVADQELAKGVRKMKAKKGLVVIIDPFSGRVLAMANYPSFDPNKQQNYPQDIKRNRIITDVYEPGSTMKIFTAAILLQEKLKKKNDLVFCENGKYTLHNRIIRDSKPHAWLTLQKTIEKSSNIGMIKFSSVIQKNTMFRYLKNFGFGSATGIGLLGEADGSIEHPKKWNRITKASISFGYGISVTALQLTMAYGAIVNGGYLYKPYIVDHLETDEGEIIDQARPQIVRQIISREISDELKSFMYGVVTNGTGKMAAPPGIKVGGKTGTTRKLKPDRSGYYTNKYIASFVGFAPYDHPEYVCAVIIDEPQKAHYGGSAAAPVFRKIIEKIINLNDSGNKYRYTKNRQEQDVVKKIKELPSLDGFNLAAAEALLEAKNISYDVKGEGALVKSYTINKEKVILYTGKLILTNKRVPKLTGLTLREALSKVDMSKFRIELKGKNRGIVRAQHPAPGGKIMKRTTLTLTCR